MRKTGYFVSFLCIALGLAAGGVYAADLTWDHDANGSPSDGSGTWLSANQWWDGAASATWNNTTPDNATIGSGGSGGTITLGSVQAGTVLFTNFSGTYTLSGGTLTNSGGITVATDAGTVTIITPIGGAGGLTKLDSGILTLRSGNATNTYTGATIVSGGILQLGNGYTDTQRSIPGGFGGSPSGSNIKLNGGNLKIWWPFTRSIGPNPENIQFTGGAGGFSFMQADRYGQITFSNNVNYEVVWGSPYFNPDPLVLNEAAANPGQNVKIQNKIDLNGTNRTVACNSTKVQGSRVDSNNGYMTTAGGRMTGVIRNTGGTPAGLIKTGPGDLQLEAANTYDGATWAKQGTLSIYNGDDRLPVGTTLTLGDSTNSGTFQLRGRRQALAGLLTSGTGTDNKVVNGESTTGTLTLNISSGTNLFDGALGGSGTDENEFGLTKQGAGELRLAGTNTYSWVTRVEEGTLSLTNSNALSDSGMLDIRSGAKVRVLSDETVGKLLLNGELMPEGTWGSTASTATYQNDTYFDSTDPGVLTVGAAYDILVYDDFDTGSLENWTAGASAGLYTGSTYSYTTNNAARMTDGTMTLTAPLKLDSLGYTNVTISFNRKIVTGSGTRKLYTKYSSNNGTNWTDLGYVTYDGFKSYTLAEGSYSFTDSAKFRFSFYDSGGPICYVDDILITGTPEYLPAISNTAATSVTSTSATFNCAATVMETARDFYVHWGPTDGSNNPASWSNSTYVGSWTNESLVNVSFSTNGFSGGTKYYYTFRESNDTAVIWASPSESFWTAADPTVSNAIGAAILGLTSATLNGELTDGGSATAWICWGDNDGGTNGIGAWDNNISVGAVDEDGPFSATVSQLWYGVEYNYRVYVTNSVGDDWSDLVTFSMPAVDSDWSPQYISTVGWYDASDAESVQTSGTTVTNWSDKSGNNYDMNTRSGTPEFDGLAHINGLTAVRFTGTEQIYRNGIPDINLTNGVCLISAGQGGPGGDWHNWGRVKSTDGSSFLHYRRDGTNPRMTATVKINNTGNAFKFSNNPSSYSNGVPFVCAVYYDPAGTAYLRGNGGADTASGSRDAAATFTINNIQAGRDSNTAGNYHGEMIVLDTIDLSIIRKAEAYLAWKWGAESKLPAGHPYTNAPPPAGDYTYAVTNSSATPLTAATADLTGTLNSSQAVFNVSVYWSTSNNASIAEWEADTSASSNFLGAFTNVVNQSVTGQATSLTGNTVYYYTFMASNQYTNIWATPNLSFQSLGEPAVSNSTGATSIDETSATLRGVLTAGGAATGWICWGISDAGTDSTGDWDNVEPIGSVTYLNVFSTNVTGLATNATYWYRCYVTNALGIDWSDDASTFNGTPAGGGGGGGGDPTPGADFFVDAGQDEDGDEYWEDLTAGNPSGFGLLLDTSPAVNRVSIAGSSTILTHAYDFPGGSTGNDAGAELVASDSTTKKSFKDIGWNSQDVTLEIWFRPDNLTPTPVNGQIIFEDGGGTGLGVLIDDNELVVTHDGGSPQIRYDVSTDPSNALLAAATSEFMQAVVTHDTGSPYLTQLFVNSILVGTCNDDNNWSGGDDAAFGTRGASNVGGLGSGQMNTESFDGEIALIRVYNQQILTQPEVESNFNAIASSGGAIVNQAPTNMTTSSAVLNGSLTVGGNTNYAVYVHFGTSDGGTNFGWSSGYFSVAAYTNSTSTNETYAVSYPQSGLTADTLYYYTFRASNDAGNAWASPSWTFSTGAATGTGSVFMFK